MNRNVIRWALIAAFLVVVGMWPAAATPVTLAAAGGDHLIAAIPGPVLLLAAAVVWLRYRTTPAKAVA
ncbi:hypothetical protein [Streptomyces sp. NPDC059701]|uniref:hypothetical protein n=1 Tax=Streptomyces sp. NPDC059701 TaxID=3346914 RepID=UPI0036C519A8